MDIDVPEYKNIDTSEMRVWSANVIKATAPPLTVEMLKKMKEKIKFPTPIIVLIGEE